MYRLLCNATTCTPHPYSQHSILIRNTLISLETPNTPRIHITSIQNQSTQHLPTVPRYLPLNFFYPSRVPKTLPSFFFVFLVFFHFVLWPFLIGHIFLTDKPGVLYFVCRILNFSYSSTQFRIDTQTEDFGFTQPIRMAKMMKMHYLL